MTELTGVGAELVDLYLLVTSQDSDHSEMRCAVLQTAREHALTSTDAVSVACFGTHSAQSLA
jgi:hypothetical protein